MVYYGALSKGCQRCRQRKVKCDQQKPACLKCQKSKTPCPGYRNLNDLIFRDESERIARAARQTEHSDKVKRLNGLVDRSSSGALKGRSSIPVDSSFPQSAELVWNLPQDVRDLGAGFFFAKYTLCKLPYTSDFKGWLCQSYLDTADDHVLRAAIEAVGLAALSNVSNRPQIAALSRRRYSEALIAMNKTLDNRSEATADTTLMAVTLFRLFEVVTFEPWDRPQYCSAHVRAALILLQLRGPEQFTHERGGHLFVHIRSEILLACMQQRIAVPPALVQTMYDFQTSPLRQDWRNRRLATSGSICEIAFRIVNLHAGVQSSEIRDPGSICAKACEIEADLKSWEIGLDDRLRFSTVSHPEGPVPDCFNGQRHIYPNSRTVETWNSWRMMRIIVSQFIIENEARFHVPNVERMSEAAHTIRQFSTDICISSACLMDNHRALSLVQQLHAIALEELNTRDVRSFAINQLRQIEASMGVRQAGALARAVAAKVGNAEFI